MRFLERLGGVPADFIFSLSAASGRNFTKTCITIIIKKGDRVPKNNTGCMGRPAVWDASPLKKRDEPSHKSGRKTVKRSKKEEERRKSNESPFSVFLHVCVFQKEDLPFFVLIFSIVGLAPRDKERKWLLFFSFYCTAKRALFFLSLPSLLLASQDLPSCSSMYHRSCVHHISSSLFLS